jgi:hypothetical protein
MNWVALPLNASLLPLVREAWTHPAGLQQLVDALPADDEAWIPATLNDSALVALAEDFGDGPEVARVALRLTGRDRDAFLATCGLLQVDGTDPLACLQHMRVHGTLPRMPADSADLFRLLALLGAALGTELSPAKRPAQDAPLLGSVLGLEPGGWEQVHPFCGHVQGDRLIIPD